MKKTAIVYHFFAHYRAGVLTELAHSGRCNILLVGARTDPWGKIPHWDVPAEVPFLETHMRPLVGQSGWQSGLIQLALRRDIGAIIYLANPYWPSTWLSATLARMMGKRVLYWTHGWKRRDSGIVRLLRNAYHRIAHGLLLYGHKAKEIGLAEGFAADRMHVIYNSLDYARQQEIRGRVSAERIDRVREELAGNSRNPIVICVCRLIPERRLDMLVEAVAILAKKGQGLQLVIVGDGPHRQALQQQAACCGIDVRFEGACYSEDRLAELFMAANVTVAPSQLGLTAIHSLTYGTPVITNDDYTDQGPEYEAILPGRTGELYPRSGGAAALAEAVARWTPAWPTTAAVRQQCIDRVEQFYTPQAQAARIARALDGLPADDSEWERANKS